jgi:hypothetical protein
MITRRNQCLELARIFRRCAAEAQQDSLKAARYRDLALQYESEAVHELETGPA